jgi:hypothetical protein
VANIRVLFEAIAGANDEENTGSSGPASRELLGPPNALRMFPQFKKAEVRNGSIIPGL